jgi:hypothetical protein
MNKKVMAIAAVLMTVAILATPVLAAPAERLDVTITHTQGMPSNPEGKTTPSVIWQARERTWEISVTIDIPGETSLTGIIYNVMNTRYFSTFDKTIDVSHAVLEIPTGDTFEGVMKFTWVGLYTNIFTAEIEVNGVLHGTGIYQGQTLKITSTGPVISLPPLPWEGVLIRPHD